MIHPAALDLIKQEEGLRLDAYLDAVGVPTIGYGHTRRAQLGLTITEAEAEALLLEDLQDAMGAVGRLVTVPLSPLQHGALVSLVFNIGQGLFGASTLLRLLNEGDYEGAAEQFRWWRKAGGEILPGLCHRRGREEQLYRMGTSEAVAAREERTA